MKLKAFAQSPTINYTRDLADDFAVQTATTPNSTTRFSSQITLLTRNDDARTTYPNNELSRSNLRQFEGYNTTGAYPRGVVDSWSRDSCWTDGPGLSSLPGFATERKIGDVYPTGF